MRSTLARELNHFSDALTKDINAVCRYALKGRKMIAIGREDGRIIVKFPYNQEYIAKIKTVNGHRWHPESQMKTRV